MLPVVKLIDNQCFVFYFVFELFIFTVTNLF